MSINSRFPCGTQNKQPLIQLLLNQPKLFLILKFHFTLLPLIWAQLNESTSNQQNLSFEINVVVFP